jgi:prophage regulatory protein
MAELKIMKRKEVEAMTGLGRSSIYAKMESNAFPKAIKLSERSVGWLEHEVQAWLASRVMASRLSRPEEVSYAC